ncbi:MAG: sugar transferase [Hyphomonadaceae bacterium]
MDLAMSLTLFIFLLPLLLVVALMVKLGDGGPVFFSHARCGFGGRMFRCHKFRTMHTDAAARLEHLLATDPEARREWAETQKLRNDPRITPIGRILRKSSIDELPQLLNIIMGQMSVIGPRPITTSETHRYGVHFADYASVRPGVLGLWQVSGRNNTTYDERVALDVEYVRNWSLWLDIKILFKAIPAVLFAKGAY